MNSPAAASEPIVLPLDVEDFLNHLLIEKGRSPNTLAAYRRDLLKYVAFLGQTPVRGADHKNVEDFATSPVSYTHLTLPTNREV